MYYFRCCKFSAEGLAGGARGPSGVINPQCCRRHCVFSRKAHSTAVRCAVRGPGHTGERYTETSDVNDMSEEILLKEYTFLFVTDVLPSFCDMGNAISSLIGQTGVEGAGLDEDGEENVLLSEEHSLLLTCCWVSLKVKVLEG